MKAPISKIVLLSLMGMALNFGVSSAVDYPAAVGDALEAAGENRSELERVLTHYEGDSLKLEAVYFLLSNMEGHGYVMYSLVDSNGNEIDLNVLEYPNFDSLLTFCKGLEEQHGELDFEKNEKVEDLKTITADFLIEQIDYAFRAWREKSWAKELTFDQLYHYVLPYRGSNEPLEPWRRAFFEKYNNIEDNLSDPSDPIEAAALINDDIMSWFTFDSRFYLHPTDQGLSEMRENRMGRCEDMTNLTIYALRANGIAVTSDYTPYWANTGNNHAWNAIVTPGRKAIPFMGAESNPGKYKLAYKFAKIYRKMFGKQESNLVFQDRHQEKLPRWLSGKNFVDVTAEYTDVIDAAINFNKAVPDTVDMAYICVFNSGEWKPIHWGRIQDGGTVFTGMVADIAYLPALYIDEEIVPYGDPFILAADGTQRALHSGGGITDSLTIEEISMVAYKTRPLTVGKEYELFYWLDGWESLGSAVSDSGSLIFQNVPADCLYWLVEEDSDKEERIFTIEEEKQVWW